MPGAANAGVFVEGARFDALRLTRCALLYMEPSARPIRSGATTAAAASVLGWAVLGSFELGTARAIRRSSGRWRAISPSPTLVAL